MKQLKNSSIISCIALVTLCLSFTAECIFAQKTDPLEEVKVFIQKENFREASKKVNLILESGDVPEAHYYKAQILVAKGKKQEALNYLTELIGREKTSSYIYIRGKLLAELGYLQSAKQDLVKVYQDKKNRTADLLELLAAISRGEGNYKQALIYLNEAVDRYPETPVLWFDKGKVELGLSLFHEAKRSVLKAVSLSQKNFSYHKVYIDILGLFKSQKELKQHLEEMAQIFPDNPWVILRLSTVLIEEKKFYEAKDLLRAALKKHPKNSQLLFQIGTIFAATKNFENAAVVFNAGLQQKPNATWAKIQLAKIYIRLSNLKSATRYLEEARSEKTKDLLVYETLAKIYNQSNDTFLAEQVIIDGLKLQPQNLFLLLEYANVLLKQHHQLSAIRAFEEALKIRKSNYGIYGKLGNLYRVTGQPEKAEKYLKTAIQMNPGTNWVRAYYVELLFEKKRWQDALEILDEMIEINPKDYWPYTKRSIIEIRLEEYKEALESIERALEINEGQFLLGLLKAEILEYLGKYKDAEQIYLSVPEKSQKNNSISTKLAYIQLHLDRKKAVKSIKTAIEQDNFEITTLELLGYLNGKTADRWSFKTDSPAYHAYEKILYKSREDAAELLDDLKSDEDPNWVYLNYLYELLFEKEAITPINLADYVSKKLSAWQLYYLGSYALDHKKNEMAKVLFEKMLEISPDDVWGTGKLALTYENLGQIEQAVGLYQKFLKKTPKSNWALLRLALNYDVLKMPKASEDAYLKLLERTPEDNVVLNNLAWLYLTANDPDVRKVGVALKLSMKAIKINATSANLDTLAEAYYQNGEFKKALKTIQSALDKDRRKSDYFKKQKKKILKAIDKKEKNATR